MKCPNCQQENPEDARFCNSCGKNLDVICSECGKTNPSGSRFCNGCGRDLSLPLEASLKELSFDEKLEKIQKYLPGGLTEKILAQRGKIEGERKQVTVLFCDMEGSTPLIEKLGPEQAYSIMDQVYEILIHKVHEFQGTVNEMTGDGVMALFGAPIAIENAPQRAIQSALAIHRELARFNDRKKREGLSAPIRMRIGIHSGPVVVGTLGNDLRVEFKAVGDTVILASRLEKMAEPGTTYVTEETFKLAEGLFRFEALGGKAIKGKGEPIRVYRVIAPSTRSTRFEVSAERGLTPFVGRERELELLLDGFERIKAGRGQAFSVVAEAGVGKTRLLYEFRKAIANEDVTIREGRCLSYSQSEAYRPIAEILKSNFDIYEHEEDFIIREKVRRGLKAIQADETSTLPYLLELFSVGESGINKALSADERKYQFMEALRRVALKGSEVRPLIMAIEDLHWIDKGSEEVLKGLFESIAGSRILLIFTYRPEFVHTWGTKTFHSQVMLNRLSNRESLNMVSHLLDAPEVDPALEELILEKTEGVPFYIEELIKSLKDLRIIERKNGRYDLSKDAKNLAIPSTIQDVILARVDPLPEGAKEVLQAGSAIEREFSYELIQRVTGFPERELLSSLSILKDSELVYERGVYPGSRYIFKHALTRQVVYDSILTGKREAMHQRIGQAIEALYQNRLEEFYEALAYHFTEGRDREKAYRYLKFSADKALGLYAYQEAVHLLEQALVMQEALHPEDRAMKCDLQIALCDALLLAGKPRRVLDKEAPEAWSLSEAMGDKKRALRICISVIWALAFHGQGPAFGTPEAITWVERADPLAEPETKERAVVDMSLGMVNLTRRNPEGFIHLRRALELARKLGDKNTFWITAFAWLTHAQAPQHTQERLNLAEELMAQTREGVDLKTLLFGLELIYDAFLAMGQRRRAEEAFRELKDLAGRSGQAHFKLTILTLEAINEYLDGCLEEAVATIDHVFALSQELDLARFATINIYVFGTRPFLYLGKAENVFEKILPPRDNPIYHLVRVIYSAHFGKADEASESLNRMVRRRFQMDLREDEPLAWIDTLLLEAAILVGHREAADVLPRRFAGSPVRTTGIFWPTIIARHLGAAAAMLGRLDEAKAHYLDAIQTATDMRFRPELALSRFQLAELLLDHYPEEREQALEHLDFAIKEFEAMKMQPSLEKAQALRESR